MNCLETPVILKQILLHFSNRELLQLSLVNKNWNYEARSVLRDRTTLTVIIRSTQSCQKIIDFAADLKKIRVVPFAGIQLILSRRPSPSEPSGSLEESYKTILQRLPCRHFYLHFNDESELFRDSPAFELVTAFLKDYCNILEELSITFCPTQEEMPQNFVQCQIFLRLKTLKIEVHDQASVHESYRRFLKAVVSRAPNLEELHIRGRVNLNEDVLEGSSAVLVPCLALNPFCERVREGLVGAPRPSFIDLKAGESFNVELLNRHIPRVLQASLSTLHILHMDLLFAVPLICYGIYFENVTVLIIRVNDRPLPEHLQPHISHLLKKFDFTRTFPKLSQINIFSRWESAITPEQLSAFVAQGHVVLKELLPDRAVNIKQLALLGYVSDSTIAFLAQIFPDVNRLLVGLRSVPFEFLTLSYFAQHFRYLKQVVPVFPAAE